MQTLKPLNFFQSVALFGLSAIVFRICVYGLMPALQKAGIPDFWAFISSYSLPLLLLLIATFIGLHQEGTTKDWRVRLRLTKIPLKAFLACLGLFGLSFLLTGLLIPTAKYLASIEIFRPPNFLPDILNPNKTVPGKQLSSFMGVELAGAYWIVPVYFLFLTLFNILGEELWFRGYILPRQELKWGNKAWLYHGIFWCLFHFPIYPWTIVYLLPTTLTVSFATQRFQNTWAGFTIHYLGNGILALLPIVVGVFR